MGSRDRRSPQGRPTSPESLLEDLGRRSLADAGIPADVVAYAIEATQRALGRWGESAQADARTRSYYRAVVRRRIAKRHGASLAAARLVADSVVADLVESGRDVREAVEELERGWTVALPPELIAEYRERLCA